MRSFLLSLPLVALISLEVSAFPSMAKNSMESLSKRLEMSGRTVPRVVRETAQKHAKRQTTTFNAAEQHVSTTGTHAFVAPDFDSGDQRGPCPGLNAAANHNYIAHSGVDTFNNILAGVNEAYGMALDLATFLAVYGTVFDGNPVSLDPGYSIGGPSTLDQNILDNALGLLGEPQGLIGSHNKYEADTSPTRGDLYTTGNNYQLQLDQAEQYVDAIPTTPMTASALYDELFTFRQSRFNDSLENNPHFFFSPFAGVLVAPAGYNFPPRMMSNKSEEYPEGYLSREVFMSFFALSGEPGSLVYTEGNERIPDNWYKLATGDEYTIAGFLADVINYAEKDPRLLDIGGNTDGVNTFGPIDIGSFTKGVFPDTTDLLDGNNLECFILQSIQAATPDFLGGGIDTNAVYGQLSDTIVTQLAGAGCPQLASVDTSLYDTYPGYSSSQGAV